jgi:hypothetical protein
MHKQDDLDLEVKQLVCDCDQYLMNEYKPILSFKEPYDKFLGEGSLTAQIMIDEIVIDNINKYLDGVFTSATLGRHD